MADKKFISVPDTNLFQNGVVYDLGYGELWLNRERINIEPSEEDVYHTITAGQTLSHIAWKHYKKHTKHASKLWWIIADANDEITNVLDMDSLIGQEILIPDYNRIQHLL